MSKWETSLSCLLDTTNTDALSSKHKHTTEKATSFTTLITRHVQKTTQLSPTETPTTRNQCVNEINCQTGKFI